MVMRSEDAPCCPAPVQLVSSCDDPVYVQICPPSPDAPQVELSDVALGCALDAQGNAIGKVLLSKVYNEETGVQTQTLVMYPYSGAAPVSPYVGAFGDCGEAEVTSVEGCFAGIPVVIHFIHGTPGDAPVSIITNVDGVIVAGANASNTVAGVCPVLPVETPHYVYMERNGGVVTVADIQAASGARHVLSVTVKQMNGRGEITADAGSGVPIDAGETWSWSVQTDDHNEFLTQSALTLNAGDGEQRITATYIR